jgi:hypothetical protein
MSIHAGFEWPCEEDERIEIADIALAHDASISSTCTRAISYSLLIENQRTSPMCRIIVFAACRRGASEG